MQQRGVGSLLTLLSVFSGFCMLNFGLRFVVCCKTRVVLKKFYIPTDLCYFTLFGVVAFTMLFFFALRTGRSK